MLPLLEMYEANKRNRLQEELEHATKHRNELFDLRNQYKLKEKYLDKRVKYLQMQYYHKEQKKLWLKKLEINEQRIQELRPLSPPSDGEGRHGVPGSRRGRPNPREPTPEPSVESAPPEPTHFSKEVQADLPVVSVGIQAYVRYIDLPEGTSSVSSQASETFVDTNLDIFNKYQQIKHKQAPALSVAGSVENVLFRELQYDVIKQERAVEKLVRADHKTMVQVIVVNDFVPQTDDYTDPTIKPLTVGELFYLLRGGDPDGQWIEAVNVRDNQVASTDHICTFPSKFMAIYDKKLAIEVVVAIDEFDAFEMFEQDAEKYGILSFKYSDIIAVTQFEVQPGWSEGYVINRMNLLVGRFPTAFVTSVEKNIEDVI